MIREKRCQNQGALYIIIVVTLMLHLLQLKKTTNNTLIQCQQCQRPQILIVAPSNKLLDKTKPSAAKAQPEALFNKVMATGMSAPPTCGGETVNDVLDWRMLDVWEKNETNILPNGGLMLL